jgi:hypothetical protein
MPAIAGMKPTDPIRFDSIANPLPRFSSTQAIVTLQTHA